MGFDSTSTVRDDGRGDGRGRAREASIVVRATRRRVDRGVRRTESNGTTERNDDISPENRLHRLRRLHRSIRARVARI